MAKQDWYDEYGKQQQAESLEEAVRAAAQARKQRESASEVFTQWRNREAAQSGRRGSMIYELSGTAGALSFICWMLGVLTIAGGMIAIIVLGSESAPPVAWLWIPLVISTGMTAFFWCTLGWALGAIRKLALG